MEKIVNNPYRILGVFSNASLKDITANKTKLVRYASVGKSVSFDSDLNSILPPVERTEASVEKAFADLSLPQDKLKYALFWFVKDNAIDEMALGHLNAGNSDKAEELFEKRESWSGLHNAGVLALIRNNWGKALGCLTKVIHISDYRSALVNAVCGDTYQIEESDLARMFVDSIRAIKSASELYTLFSANGYDNSEANYLKGSMTDEPKEKLNAEISKVKAAKENGVTMYEAGTVFQQNAQPLLKQLEGLLGADSMEYKLLVDKYAKALLQCCIDSFNTLQNKIDDGEAVLFKEYAPKIKALLESIDIAKVSDVVKGRIETNMKTISEVVEDLDGYVLSNSHLCYYCGKNKAVPSAQFKQMMYLETERKTTFNKRQVFFKQLEIGIDRCEQCKEIHDKGSGGILAVYAIFAIAGIIVLSVFTSFLLGLFVGWIPGVIIGYIVESISDGSKRRKYHVKVEKDIYEHPLVKRLTKEGWTTTKPTA